MGDASRRHALLALLARRVVRLDGAMGTMLGGPNPDALVLTAPAHVARLHQEYLAAGADIVRTATFRATSLAQQDFGLAGRAGELNLSAARLARRAADTHAGGSARAFVAGVLGPVRGAAGEVRDAYREQAQALLAGGVDLLLIETAVAASQALHALDAIGDVTHEIPVMVSATIDATGRLPSGETVTAFHHVIYGAARSHALRGLPLVSIGLNCGVGARGMRAAVEELAGVARVPVSCHPSAGLPDARGLYPEDAATFAAALATLAADGLIRIVGGCCGTTPAYVAELARSDAR